MHTPFGEALRRHGAADLEDAIVGSPGRLSYQELAGRVDACAHALVADGCRAGEVVGIAVDDDVAHLVACFALLVLGIPQVPLPTFDPPAVRRGLAERLRVSRVIVADPAHAVAGIAMTRVDAGAPKRNASAVPPLDADPDAIALYQPTSGTTGEPKILPLTQRMVATRQGMRNFEAGERILVPMSIETYPAKSARIGAALRGLTTVIVAGAATSARRLADGCHRHGVTRVEVGALQVTNLLQHGAGALPAHVKVFASGSRIPMRTRNAFRAASRARLFVEYGSRELGAGTTTYPADRDPAIETVGSPVAGCVLEVVDAGGRAVAPGDVGEIRGRAPGMVAGYVDDAAATARRFRDGWYYPGDLGSFTPHGSLCLAGRIDDVINLNGIKIHPSEIERVFEDQDGVVAAAAFAIASPVHGQIPAVAIEWRGLAPPDVPALQEAARSRLGSRAPRKVVLVEALPRNASGKVLTAELERLARADRDTAEERP